MRSRKRPALSLVTGVVLMVAAAPSGAAAQQPPRDPQRPHTGNMELVGQSLRAGAVTGPPPVGPGTVPWDTRNTDLAFWGDTVIQGRYDGFRVIDVSNPRRPRERAMFPCVSPQGDVGVYGHLVFRSVDSPQLTDRCTTASQSGNPAGADCAPVSSPCTGFEGIQIFDISRVNRIRLVASVALDCGSHTHTVVPDERHDRVLIYNSVSGTGAQANPGRYGNRCPGEPFGRQDIVEVPLDDPQQASVIGSFDLGRLADGTMIQACHDMGVILGRVDRAACAGNPRGIAVFDIRDLDDPQFLYAAEAPTVTGWHSAAFTWDGRQMIGGWEPGGGTQPRCQVTGAPLDGGLFQTDEMKTLFIYDARTGQMVGRHVLPRPQSPYENCTMHNYNIVPAVGRDLLVHGSYQAGTALMDFTDPLDTYEIAWMDPLPLDPPVPGQHTGGRTAFRGGDWSSYWYNGYIYESDTRRGLYIWSVEARELRGPQVSLEYLNPQTQHVSIDRRGRVHDDRDRVEPGARPGLKEVGHEPLLARGMNAALAVHGDYAYIGSRTDWRPGAPHGGLLVVDVSKPHRPKLIGGPFDGHPGESTRELRVWHSQQLLIVLNTNCGVGPTLHHCTSPSVSNVRFYDISGANARQPRPVSRFDVDTHEFFLWEDPRNPRRALLFAGNASSTCATRGGSPSCPFAVWDISDVRGGRPPVTLYSGPHGYTPSGTIPAGGLHSLSVSNDGTRAYFALLTGGFAVVDVSDFARGVPSPQPRPVTANAGRPTWAGPGAHSAIKLWGRDWVWVSDEVYGTATGSGHGCPWGWARLIDIANPTVPTVRAEYKLPQNEASACPRWEPRPRTSYSAHNPTLTPHIAFSTWHSGGLQAVSIQDPRRPYQLAQFMPAPLSRVLLEDPRLSSDPDTGHGEKVVMWSYPIIKDGLIYVVDLRNGLYVLRYRGPFQQEVNRIDFLEGNSNQGDALCFEPVAATDRRCHR